MGERRWLEAAFLSRTRDEWFAVFEGSDACVTPVLGFAEAPSHPQNRARGSFVGGGRRRAASPAPRFSGTPSALPRPAPARDGHGGAALRDWGFDEAAINRLQARGLGFQS